MKSRITPAVTGSIESEDLGERRKLILQLPPFGGGRSQGTFHNKSNRPRAFQAIKEPPSPNEDGLTILIRLVAPTGYTHPIIPVQQRAHSTQREDHTQQDVHGFPPNEVDLT